MFSQMCACVKREAPKNDIFRTFFRIEPLRYIYLWTLLNQKNVRYFDIVPNLQISQFKYKQCV